MKPRKHRISYKERRYVESFFLYLILHIPAVAISGVLAVLITVFTSADKLFWYIFLPFEILVYTILCSFTNPDYETVTKDVEILEIKK